MDIAKHWDGFKDEYSDRDPETIVAWKDSYPYITDCPNVLDIGCGVGNVVSWLTGRGHIAKGVTYQMKEVTRARELGRDVMFSDMHDMELIESSFFDAFVMWDSLEHSIAPLIALSEAKRVTKGGGKGLIFIPNQNWIECHYHIIVPNIRQMKHLLKLAGLVLVDIVDMGNEQAVYKVAVAK
ncbi:MAG: class I SAM-dependent methyltransferase [Eubacteriales bacterium]